MLHVALDAMGSDDGPPPLVAGARVALEAARREGLDLRISLVGDADQLEGAAADDRLSVVHAADVIGMDEEPALAVRAKPDASVRRAVALLAEGRVEAVVSAGSTGATLTAALLGLGRAGTVRRPAIAGVVPVRGASGDDVVLVDAGGSPDVQPRALVDWARLGVDYARARGTTAPLVGLLNVGVEVGKGNELARTAHGLLTAWATEHGISFVGNVEPAHLLAGRVDVLVTDGFTGNVLAKALEATAPAAAVPPGALVLGVAGVVVVAHGAAGPEEIAAAIGTATTVAASRRKAGVA